MGASAAGAPPDARARAGARFGDIVLVVGSSLLFVLAAALWRSWGATSGLDGAAGSSCSARPRLDEKLFLESFSQPAPKKPAAAKKR